MPVTLAAASVSQEKALVWYSCLATWSGTLLWEGCSGEVSGLLRREADKAWWDRTPGWRVDRSRRNEECPGGLCVFSLLAFTLLYDARLTHPLHYMKFHGGDLPTPPLSTSGHTRSWSVLSFTFRHSVSLKKKKPQGVNINFFPFWFYIVRWDSDWSKMDDLILLIILWLRSCFFFLRTEASDWVFQSPVCLLDSTPKMCGLRQWWQNGWREEGSQ